MALKDKMKSFLDNQIEPITRCPMCDVHLDYDAKEETNSSPVVALMNIKEEPTIDNIWILCKSCSIELVHVPIAEMLKTLACLTIWKGLDPDIVDELASMLGYEWPHSSRDKD